MSIIIIIIILGGTVRAITDLDRRIVFGSQQDESYDVCVDRKNGSLGPSNSL